MTELSRFTSTAVSKRSKNTELKIPIQTELFCFLLPGGGGGERGGGEGLVDKHAC